MTRNPVDRPLILASTSAYRRELLARLGLTFSTEPPGVEEAIRPGERPGARAERLALEKARAVAERHPAAIVIGSDQVCARGPSILEKPGDAERTRAQLAELSGAVAAFHTACAVVGREAAFEVRHVDMTRVHFRELTEEEIARYVERERPYDCAGGFKSESLGVALFEHLECEDPAALVGLPLIWLAKALRSAGYRVP